jgi:basic membrane lipoprotein Med (substrate-binding protein (PBP1-ABC) superfamily)
MKQSTILLIVVAVIVIAVGVYAYVAYTQPSPPTPTVTMTFQIATPLYGYTGTVLMVDGVSYNSSQLPKSITWNANTLHNFTWVANAEVVAGEYVWASSSGPSTARSGTINATANSTMTTSYNTDTFKVAAIYVTPIEEDWNQVLHQALVKARNNLGITYVYSERTSESDCDRVAREYISNGYQMIFTDSWGFWEVADNLAPQFPNIFFAQGSGLCTHFGNNLILFDNTLQEVTFQAGAVAAKLTNTSKVGVVAAMPGPGDVASLISGFIAGAKYVNPNINVSVQYINSWYDPNAARLVAQSMITSGVDVIFSERYGIFEACKPANTVLAYAFGNVIDQNALGPDVTVGSVIWNLYPMVYEMITGALNNNYTSGIYYPTMSNGGTYMQWNQAWVAKFPTIYNYAVDLEPLIRNGTITWVVDNQTVPLSVPNFGPPQP